MNVMDSEHDRASGYFMSKQIYIANGGSRSSVPYFSLYEVFANKKKEKTLCKLLLASYYCWVFYDIVLEDHEISVSWETSQSMKVSNFPEVMRSTFVSKPWRHGSISQPSTPFSIASLKILPKRFFSL